MTWLILLEFVLECGCFCFCQAFRCQPYYLSPRGQFWGACSVTTSVAGWQQLDGGARASPQQSADSAGTDLGSQQNLKHPWLCVYQSFKPCGSVSISPLKYHIFVWIGGQKQISCDKLLQKYLTFDYASEEILFGGVAFFFFFFTKLNVLTF